MAQNQEKPQKDDLRREAEAQAQAAENEADQANGSEQKADQSQNPEQNENQNASPNDGPEEVKAETPDFREKYVRAMAEMENLRKRMAREVEDARRYGVTGFAREMLDVADNLERATAAIDKEKLERDTHLKTLAEGVEMVQGQLQRAFSKFKIEKTSPEPGEKFNPELHQAMFEVPTTDYPAGTVAQVMQPGYVIAGRLLRPAMVGTAKPPPKSDEEN